MSAELISFKYFPRNAIAEQKKIMSRKSFSELNFIIFKTACKIFIFYGNIFAI